MENNIELSSKSYSGNKTDNYYRSSENITNYADDKINKQKNNKSLISFKNDKLNNTVTHSISSKNSKLSIDNENVNLEEQDNLLEKAKLKYLLMIIDKNFDKEKNDQVRRERLSKTIEKVWKAVRKIRSVFSLSLKSQENLFYKDLKLKNSNFLSKLIMHPETNKFRIFIDTVVCICLMFDLIISPYIFMVKEHNEEEKYGGIIIFDVIFFLEIISNFFTAYIKNQILVNDFKNIAINYLKFRFFLDVLYVFPFAYIYPNMVFMRFIKIYRFPFLVIRLRIILFYITSYFVKNLKLIHSILNLIIFVIILVYVLHLLATIWVYIGRLKIEEGWLSNPKALDTTATKWDKYVASLYFLVETLVTIGYGDLPPVQIYEMIYIIIIEILSVMFFAYIISCILQIFTRFNFDEFSFKYNHELDIDSWLYKYNKTISNKIRINLLNNEDPIFESINNYFMLYHAKDHSWLKNFSFIKQMRTCERNEILTHTFKSFFDTFHLFFSGLNFHFKTEVVLNLKTKVVGKNVVIIDNKVRDPDNKNNNKNSIRYIYLIGKGSIGVYKDKLEICRLVSGSYFGDEYLINKNPEYKYKNLNYSDAFLFCCPIDLFTTLCSYSEDSYLFLLYKSMMRMNKFKMFHQELITKVSIKEKTINNNESVIKKHKSMIRNIEPDIKLNNLSNKDDLNFDQVKIEHFTENIKPCFTLGNDVNQTYNSQDYLINEDDPLLKNIQHEREYLIDPNEDYNKLIEDSNFINNIEINAENLGSMRNLNQNQESVEEYLKYADTLEKKFNFMNSQLEFIENNFKNFSDKSKEILNFVKNVKF